MNLLRDLTQGNPAEIVKNKILRKQKAKLIIITSHIISEVESLADRLHISIGRQCLCDSSGGGMVKQKTGEINLNRRNC